MRREDLFLEDILGSISNIKNFSKGLTKEKFLSNREKQSAIIREIEIISEAVKNISNETRKKYPEIEWRNIAGARDTFIHGYFQVDIERVWGIVKNSLGDLKNKIWKIKKDFEQS